jgi:hypothetical protein
MTGQILVYIGSALPVLWGVSHLFPTRGVVAGFGEISADNRRIITMEWITEGVALIFLGALVAAVTAVGHESDAALAVYIVAASCLVVLAGVSLMTGFRIAFLPFRLCPFIFSGSAALILIGGLI